ncbi:MAG: hypothetical protein AAFY35_08200 [Pseudomonadota bacterium]
MKHVLIAAIMALATLSALTLTASAQSRPSLPMTDNAYLYEYGFTPYGSVLLAASVREIGGKTAVCGFWTVKERLQAYVIAHGLDRRARQTTSIRIGNLHLLTGVDFMRKVAPEEFEVGTMARCQVTDVAWQAGFAKQKINFRTPRINIRS